MNRLFTLTLIALAGLLLASCGSSVNSSTQPSNENYVYSMVVSPIQFTLNAGDWSSITATVDVSYQNAAPKPLAPQPITKFYSSDPRITISPAGEVCAGQWDVRYLTCTPTVVPAINATTGLPNPNAGQLNLPTGYVTITAYDATRNVSATAQLSVHERAATINLSAPGYAVQEVVNGKTLTRSCISQNTQVQYVATPLDASGTPINPTISNVFANDYSWAVGDSNVAAVSSYGYVVAKNPGVTSVYATLSGTVSVPLTFVTCPPTSIVLGSFPFTTIAPLPPFTAGGTSDLDTLAKGAEEYMTATLTDINGNTLVTSPLDYITTDPLIGAFSAVLPLISNLTANTSGRFTVVASCGPPNCNAAVANFTIPGATTPITGQTAGFGYPIYSNVIGVTVEGITGSTVLVTNSDQVTNALHRMDAYDSESLALVQTVELANLPNSLVVAPNGATAYLGSSAGLTVVNLATYQSSLQTYPIVGGLSTDVITGQVLGVSPDSRYVVLSDVANNYVFLIDTTGTKSATRYTIPGINAVTFAADGSNMWIGGTNGVYVFNANAFVPTSANASTNVQALAWLPDGQSYFASGAQLIDYSTCNDQHPQTPTVNLPTSVTGALSTTALQGVPHLLGLDGSQWFDYPVTTTAQIGNPTPAGNVCLSTVTVNAPVATASSSPCTATQITFSPTLEQEFVSGASCATPASLIYGYDVVGQKEITFPTINPIVPLSGGALNDGRYLYVGSSDTTNGSVLHRIDLSAGTPKPGFEDTSTSVELVPSFVAVVPK